MVLGMLRITIVVFRHLPLRSYLTKIMKLVKPLELFRLQTAVAAIHKLLHVC